MANRRIVYPMDKRGQLEIIGVVIILLAVLIGGIYVLTSEVDGEKEVKNIKYVGDKNIRTFCNINSDFSGVPAVDRVYFYDYQDAINQGFRYVGGCP